MEYGNLLYVFKFIQLFYDSVPIAKIENFE
jgi:hypothetical protein